MPLYVLARSSTHPTQLGRLTRFVCSGRDGKICWFNTLSECPTTRYLSPCVLIKTRSTLFHLRKIFSPSVKTDVLFCKIFWYTNILPYLTQTPSPTCVLYCMYTHRQRPQKSAKNIVSLRERWKSMITVSYRQQWGHPPWGKTTPRTNKGRFDIPAVSCTGDSAKSHHTKPYST